MWAQGEEMISIGIRTDRDPPNSEPHVRLCREPHPRCCGIPEDLAAQRKPAAVWNRSAEPVHSVSEMLSVLLHGSSQQLCSTASSPGLVALVARLVQLPGQVVRSTDLRLRIHSTPDWSMRYGRDSRLESSSDLPTRRMVRRITPLRTNGGRTTKQHIPQPFRKEFLP